MTSSLVPFFFRLLNFSIIVTLGIYLYRRYGRDLLQDMFESHEEKQQALRDEVVSLGERAKDIEVAFSVQQDFIVRLTSNIEQWKVSVAQAIALRQREKETLTTLLQRKAELVARHAAWISMRRECLDSAIKEATESLTAFYADPTHAHAYITGVLVHLEERV